MPLTIDLVYGIILISFIISLSCITAGITYIKMINAYSLHLSKKFGENNVSPKIVKNGHRLSLFSIIVGIFFLYRIAFVLHTGNDFNPKDWILYDLAIGFYMLFNSLFLFSLFNERKRLDALDSNKQINEEV